MLTSHISADSNGLDTLGSSQMNLCLIGTISILDGQLLPINKLKLYLPNLFDILQVFFTTQPGIASILYNII